MREIEQRSHLSCTAIVNNSNLGEETEDDTLIGSFEYADKVSLLTGLRVAAHTTVLPGDFGCDGKTIIKINDITKHIWEEKIKNE